MQACFIRCAAVALLGLYSSVANGGGGSKEYELHVPPLDVAGALSLLAQQTDTPLLFSYDLVRALEAKPVSGRYTLTDALTVLLEGTGLSAGLTDGGVITISPAASRDTASSTAENDSEREMQPNRARKSFIAHGMAALMTWIAGAPHAAHAQTGGDTQQGSASAVAVLEEILVTAQKRVESSRDISVAVAAFTGETLNDFGVTDTTSLASLAPGVVISNVVGGSVPTISIRGMGVGAASFFANQPNSAAINVDGVHLPSAIMSNFQVFDIERVEILKGPQGTLYGRNTTAGAINFFSRRPTSEASGYIQGSYSRWNSARLESAFGGPLADSINYRVSAVYDYSDGNVTNTYDAPALGLGSQDTNGTHRYSARAQLMFAPSQATSILVNAHGGFDRSDSFHYQILPGQLAGNLDPFAQDPECFEQYEPTAPQCLTGSQLVSQADTDGDHFKVNSNLEVPSTINATGGSVQVEHSYNSVALTSLTAFDRFTRLYFEDEDGGPLTELHVYFDEDFRHFSQELRLTSNTDSRLQWIMGAFGSRLEAEMKRQADYTDLFGGFGVAYSNQIRETALAAFAHTTYDVASKVRLIAGLRYSYEKKGITVTNANIIGNTPMFSFDNAFFYRNDGNHQEDSWGNLSGKLGVEFRPVDGVLVYGHVSRGFKSGGFPGSLGVTGARLKPYRPEIADTVEVGTKTDFADGRGLIDVAAFYTHSKDRLEFASFVEDPVIVDFTNAASTKIVGVEGQFAYQLGRDTSVAIAAAWISGEYDRFVDLGSATDFSGRQLPFSPEWTANLQLNKRVALGNGGKLDIASNIGYMGEQFFNSANVAVASADDYLLWNGRVTYTSGRDGLSTSLFVRNLLNQEYRAGGGTGVTGNNYAFYGPLRAVGLELRYEW